LRTVDVGLGAHKVTTPKPSRAHALTTLGRDATVAAEMLARVQRSRASAGRLCGALCHHHRHKQQLLVRRHSHAIVGTHLDPTSLCRFPHWRQHRQHRHQLQQQIRAAHAVSPDRAVLELEVSQQQLAERFAMALRRSDYATLKAKAKALEDRLSNDSFWLATTSGSGRTTTGTSTSTAQHQHTPAHHTKSGGGDVREAMQALAQLTGRLSRLDELGQQVRDAHEYVQLVQDVLREQTASAGSDCSNSSSTTTATTTTPTIINNDSKAATNEDDLSLCVQELSRVRAAVDEFLEESLVDPTGEDARDCHLIIECGNGGLDAKDWVAMLRVMYNAWARRRGFGVVEVEVVPDKVGR
jgi:hypothetical protein